MNIAATEGHPFSEWAKGVDIEHIIPLWDYWDISCDCWCLPGTSMGNRGQHLGKAKVLFFFPGLTLFLVNSQFHIKWSMKRKCQSLLSHKKKKKALSKVQVLHYCLLKCVHLTVTWRETKKMLIYTHLSTTDYIYPFILDLVKHGLANWEGVLNQLHQDF